MPTSGFEAKVVYNPALAVADRVFRGLYRALCG
jgi:predicted GH43/DUF377 family glycosyl hydrolase